MTTSRAPSGKRSEQRNRLRRAAPAAHDRRDHDLNAVFDDDRLTEGWGEDQHDDPPPANSFERY